MPASLPYSWSRKLPLARWVAGPLLVAGIFTALYASSADPASQPGGAPPAPYGRARRYWERMRTGPTGRIDWRVYQRFYGRKPDRRPTAEGFRMLAVPPQVLASSHHWALEGPEELPAPTREDFGPGPVSGRVNALAYNPADPDTLYLGAASGGFWRRRKGEIRWECLSDDWPNPRVNSIAVHPDGKTLYVGTGDFNHGPNSWGYGLQKSLDGGKTWDVAGADALSGYSLRRIVLHPDDPETLTVTAGRNPYESGFVWRSTDGGSTWAKAVPQGADWSDVVCGERLPGGGRYYYACGLGYHGGEVWRSDAQGRNWKKLQTPLRNDVATSGLQDSLELAASATDPMTVYLLSGRDRAVWKSRDAGRSWTELTRNFPGGPKVEEDGQRIPAHWQSAHHNFHLTCARRTDRKGDVLYVGGIDLVASWDGGATWQSLGKTYTDRAETHVDQHCMAIHPENPNETLVGNDGGVYRLVVEPARNRWSFDGSLNTGLTITQFYRAAYAKDNRNVLIGGAQDNASPYRTAAGKWAVTGLGDGGFCAVHPENPRVQYATSADLYIYTTQDGWTTRTEITPQQRVDYADGPGHPSWGTDTREFIAPIALDPAEPHLLYAGTTYLWRWDASQREWTPRLGGQLLSSSGTAPLTYIAVAPSHNRYLYVGNRDGEIWMSPDQGLRWRRLDREQAPLASGGVSGIAVHPRRPWEVVVAFSGTGGANLWRCANTTRDAPAWRKITGEDPDIALPDLPINAVAMDPRPPHTGYYVGTDGGFYYSRDGGVSWEDGTRPLGLPNVPVMDVQVVRKTGRVMAATWGRGIWSLDWNAFCPTAAVR